MTVGPSTSARTLTLKVLLFATYAEQAGRESVVLTLPDPATVADVLHHLRSSVPGLDRLPIQPLAAVNQAHARLTAPVRDGDEVAFLPPLAGG